MSEKWVVQHDDSDESNIELDGGSVIVVRW
jgi:hypothetical protein